ncbi:hypothetical protein ACFX15_024788 [Malus domestica]
MTAPQIPSPLSAFLHLQTSFFFLYYFPPFFAFYFCFFFGFSNGTASFSVIASSAGGALATTTTSSLGGVSGATATSGFWLNLRWCSFPDNSQLGRFFFSNGKCKKAPECDDRKHDQRSASFPRASHGVCLTTKALCAFSLCRRLKCKEGWLLVASQAILEESLVFTSMRGAEPWEEQAATEEEVEVPQQRRQSLL